MSGSTDTITGNGALVASGTERASIGQRIEKGTPSTAHDWTGAPRCHTDPASLVPFLNQTITPTSRRIPT